LGMGTGGDLEKKTESFGRLRSYLLKGEGEDDSKKKSQNSQRKARPSRRKSKWASDARRQSKVVKQVQGQNRARVLPEGGAK